MFIILTITNQFGPIKALVYGVLAIVGGFFWRKFWKRVLFKMKENPAGYNAQTYGWLRGWGVWGGIAMMLCGMILVVGTALEMLGVL